MRAKKLLFGLLLKLENSQSVLSGVHHQQHCKEQEGDTKANFCFLAQACFSYLFCGSFLENVFR